ncbi:hypothetical protein V6V89_05335 [Micromonospora sp. CPCC 206061]
MRMQHLGRAGAALVAVILVGGATACSTSDKSSNSAAAAPAATASNDAEAAKASKAALAAYKGYLTASRVASLDPDPKHPDLTKYVADPLLTRVRDAVRDLKTHGAVRTGKLASDPHVTTVDLAAEPPTVSIQDCIDSTGYKMVYANSKKPVPGAAGGRFVATATATRYPDGRWLISDGATHEDQPC